MKALSVVNANILSTECDVLILKYTQGFHGADEAVARALGLPERDNGALSSDKYLHIPTNGKLPCKRVLLISVLEFWKFNYAAIRQFSKDALTILAKEDCDKAFLGSTEEATYVLNT